MFTHVHTPLGYYDLLAETTDTGRLYTTPSGQKYPSITTVLGWRQENWIEEWRARVGVDEANRVSGRAKRIGSTVHDLFEQYVNNHFIDTARLMPHVAHRFRMIRAILDEHVDRIRAVEAPLYSAFLRVAGRVDLIAEYDKKLSIIDYKTSNHLKSRDEITNYFLQSTAYADMFEEQTGQKVEQIVILMMVDGHGALQFIEKPSDWRKQLYERIKDYYSSHAPADRVSHA